MPRHRPSPLMIVALFAVVAFAGCTGPSPEPAPTSVPTPTTAPEPVDAGPSPRIDATCDDIVDVAALQSFIGVNEQPLVAVAPADRLTPDGAAGEQLGALECAWDNELPADYFVGSDLNGQTASLRILPEGIDAAIAYVDLYQIADPTYGDHVQGPRCLGPADGLDPGFCELYGVIGQTWVELTVHGIVATADVGAADLVAGFRSVIDPMVTAVKAMTPPDRWVPATPSAIVGSDCDTLAPTDAIIGVTAIPELRVGLQWDGPRVGQYWYATTEVGALRCSLAMANSELSVGQIGILPSGAWAFQRFADAWLADGGTVVELDGVPAGDAIARCADASAECIVDVAVAGDWIRVAVPTSPGPQVEHAPPAAYFESARAAATDIAAIVAGQITAR